MIRTLARPPDMSDMSGGLGGSGPRAGAGPRPRVGRRPASGGGRAGLA